MRAFLLDVLPSDVAVIAGLDNRVPESSSKNSVVMIPLRRPRLSTNVTTYADALFTGAIAATTLTVTEVTFGVIKLGSPVFGIGVAAGTKVTQLLTGTGGVGTYKVSPSQTVAAETMAAGRAEVLQPTEVRMQLDVHGPDSANNAQIISTMLRDPFGVDKFRESGFDVVPLYSEDPRQIPFTNEGQQVEQRWVVEAVLQANQVVTVPQRYAGALEAGLVNVDAVYPPT